MSFPSWPGYREMLGGYFDGHPWGEFQAPLVVEDPGFPGMGHLPRSFTLRDEIYQLKDFSRAKVRVLLRLDAGKVDLSRKGVRRKDNADKATVAAPWGPPAAREGDALPRALLQSPRQNPASDYFG